MALTPSGGLHFYFKAGSESHLRNSAGLLAEGVDVRGEGGYIGLPPSLPSLHLDEYQWEGGSYGCL